MTNAMEKSPLWQRTFAESNDPNVTRLVTSLRGARDRVGHLTSRIAASLSSLTMHDSSHLDGLWTVAGTIAGKDFLLNPLEGTVKLSGILGFWRRNRSSVERRINNLVHKFLNTLTYYIRLIWHCGNLKGVPQCLDTARIRSFYRQVRKENYWLVPENIRYRIFRYSEPR